MGIPIEEKKYLVEQIENLTGSRPLFYLKFCSREKFASDICEGKLYGNTAKYFRDKELKTGERGQGDIFELLLSIKTERVSLIDNDTGNLVLSAPNGTLNVQFKGDDTIPIVSFVGIPLIDMELLEVDETHAKFKFPFTEKEYDTMSERFGEYCVIISAREIEAQVASYCKHFSCDYIFDRVEYCDQNRIDRMQAFNKCSKERFLYKNSDLEYQREYRLAFGMEMPEDHYINLDPIKSAKIISSKSLKNIIFVIDYKSYKKDEEKVVP